MLPVRGFLIRKACNVVLQYSKREEITFTHDFIFVFIPYLIGAILSKKMSKVGGRQPYNGGVKPARIVFKVKVAPQVHAINKLTHSSHFEKEIAWLTWYKLDFHCFFLKTFIGYRVFQYFCKLDIESLLPLSSFYVFRRNFIFSGFLNVCHRVRIDILFHTTYRLLRLCIFFIYLTYQNESLCNALMVNLVETNNQLKWAINLKSVLRYYDKLLSFPIFI